MEMTVPQIIMQWTDTLSLVIYNSTEMYVLSISILYLLNTIYLVHVDCRCTKYIVLSKHKIEILSVLYKVYIEIKELVCLIKRTFEYKIK